MQTASDIAATTSYIQQCNKFKNSNNNNFKIILFYTHMGSQLILQIK